MEGIEGAVLLRAPAHAYMAFFAAHIAAFITHLVMAGEAIDASVGGVIEGHIHQR